MNAGAHFFESVASPLYLTAPPRPLTPAPPPCSGGSGVKVPSLVLSACPCAMRLGSTSPASVTTLCPLPRQRAFALLSARACGGLRSMPRHPGGPLARPQVPPSGGTKPPCSVWAGVFVRWNIFYLMSCARLKQRSEDLKWYRKIKKAVS